MKRFYIFFLTLTSQLALAQNDFITRWNLAISGSGATQLSFGVGTTGTVSYTWQEVSPGTASGSGTFTGSTAIITSLPEDAVIDLSISPTNFGRININNGADKNRLTGVSQWGTIAWTSMVTAFYGCSNLQISATDLPDMNAVTNMTYMFDGCRALNGPANIGLWNTANVTNMAYLFGGAAAFNQNIATWNTANVTRMDNMFSGASVFNQPIGAWDTGKVANMSFMFSHAFVFNQPIANFNTANVTDMQNMFYNARLFNQPIGNWNTAKVTDMSGMFYNADAFNQPIHSQANGIWSTANVTDMNYMFANNRSFNQPIGNWDTGKVTNMQKMFVNNDSFNQPIGGWNTGNVTDMSSMFSYATVFNQPIGTWDTRKVVNMSSMFQATRTFNQPIGTWDTGNVTNMSSMFSYATVFNQPIGTWDTGNVTNMNSMFGSNSSFNKAIGTWNTGKVTNMSGMFSSNSGFNQPINNWDTGSVTNMSSMFSGNSIFNQPVGGWDTGNVTNMGNMFAGATVFNQPIGNWNTAKVISMSNMFSSASSFNQSLGTWTLPTAVSIQNMLNLSGMDCYHYSATLIGWSNNPNTPNGRLLGAGGKGYGTNAVAAHAYLTDTKGWTIINDATSGVDCSSQLPVTLVSFSGKKTAENRNILKWITADEKDFDRFEIQRSPDAKGFETIGNLLGQRVGSLGNEVGMLNAYTFTDVAPGIFNYYRLKMVDKDGSFEYSRIISIENSAEQDVLGSFYPNPSTGKVFVDVYAAESSSWTLTVTDAGGKILGTQVHDLQKGMNKISLSRMSSGLNLVRFEHGAFSEVRKLISE